jgi:hypothetical protein
MSRFAIVLAFSSLTACSGGHAFLQGHSEAKGGDAEALEAGITAGDAHWVNRLDRACRSAHQIGSCLLLYGRFLRTFRR